MANNYIQGTVAPMLPLQHHHLAVMSLLQEHGEALPPGLDMIDDKIVVADAEEWTFSVWEAYAENVDMEKVLEGLRSIHTQRGGSFFNLHWEDCGNGTYYLFAEDGLEDTDLCFLQWVIKDMPPEIGWISCEFASYCSKLRPGEFGGGAWFITRQDTETMFTGSWLYEQQVRLLEAGGVGGQS